MGQRFCKKTALFSGAAPNRGILTYCERRATMPITAPFLQKSIVPWLYCLSNPPNIQRFPTAIHAQETALMSGWLPNTLKSIAAAIPTGRENTAHRLRHGVYPLKKALICVISNTAKNIQNIINAGSKKYAAYFSVTSVAIPCFVKNTRAQVGTW